MVRESPLETENLVFLLSDLHSDIDKSLHLSRPWCPHLRSQDLDIAFPTVFFRALEAPGVPWALMAWGGG